MRTAEQAVRAQAIALLAGDAGLAGRVHGVFDGYPPRATAPYIAVGAAEGSDWGTKDRPGREIRLTITLHGAGESRADEAAAGIEQAASALRGACRRRYSPMREGMTAPVGSTRTQPRPSIHTSVQAWASAWRTVQ